MSIPHLHQNQIIVRPRLSARLEEGLQRRLTLITAPAGAGKTTLLAQWAQGAGRPVAWVTLAEHDREPARFLARLVAGLQTVAAGTGLSLPGQSPEAGLLALVNEAARVPGEWALILDNCQAVQGSALGPLTSPLLDYLPPQLHLVLASRAVPDLPLGRLRVRGQLAELTGADLLFAPEEAGALLQQVSWREVSAAEAAALHERTDGWAPGLLRAAAALRSASTAEVLATFSGRDPELAQYLAVEVLHRQAPEVRAFLLQTATLARLSASLCNEVTGRRDGQAMLEYLERANLFVIPLDHERRWYRYYRLFAEFLQTHGR